MKRAHYIRSEKTKKELDEIEKFNGSKHSATIRIAVAEYYKKNIKGE